MRTVLAGVLLQVSTCAARAAEPPRLVVVLVVDQLRGDEIERFRPLWRRGMARLRKEGRWYREARHGHGRSETAAGHATIATGLHPRWHGVVDKVMYDEPSGELRTVCDYGHGPCDPVVLLAPTLGDRLKVMAPAARVVAVSGKARSATLLGGTRADLVAWPDRPPQVLLGRTATGKLPSWLTRAWAHLASPERLAAPWRLPVLPKDLPLPPDAAGGEQDIGSGITFPHRAQGTGADAHALAWKVTPDFDAATLEIAIRAARELQLGADDVPDLWLLSLSGFDYIGHAYGPDSLERVAALAALDEHIESVLVAARLLAGDRVLMALTSDHGTAPTVATAQARGLKSGRISVEDLLDHIAQYEPGAVAALWPPYVTLTAKARERGAAAGVCAALKKHPAVAAAWPVANLALTKDEPGRLMLANSHPERSGDVAFVFAPYFAAFDPSEGALGAEHGSVWDYDRHVPVMLWGTGVVRGEVRARVEVIDLMRTLADQLGLPADPRGGKPLP